MVKDCYSCRFREKNNFEVPCLGCEKHNHWKEPEDLFADVRDTTQCWLELTALYSHALMNSEGIDEEYYEAKMEQFRNKLSEFSTAIANEDREEFW